MPSYEEALAHVEKGLEAFAEERRLTVPTRQLQDVLRVIREKVLEAKEENLVTVNDKVRARRFKVIRVLESLAGALHGAAAAAQHHYTLAAVVLILALSYVREIETELSDEASCLLAIIALARDHEGDISRTEVSELYGARPDCPGESFESALAVLKTLGIVDVREDKVRLCEYYLAT